jgi:hypothetical protein
MSEGNDGKGGKGGKDGKVVREYAYTRNAAETLIAKSFYPIVYNAVLTVSSAYRNDEIPVSLTDQEQYTTNKYTYFGWTVAVVSGFGTFATLFGGLRFGAYLMSRRPSLQLSRPTYHAEMAQKRAKFSYLDNPTASSNTRSKLPPPSSSSSLEAVDAPARQGGSSVWSDVTIHVQFMLCSAVALMTALAMGNKFTGGDYPDKLAELPLQKGTSIFCERYLCPAVLQHHRDLLGQQQQPVTYARLYDSILWAKRKSNQVPAVQTASTASTTDTTTTDDADSDDAYKPSENTVYSYQVEQMKAWQKFDRDASIPTPKDVYGTAQTETPETALLETLQRFVYHCQCREAFALDCRQRNESIDPRTNLVIVPESGVPLGYLEANRKE